MIDFIFFFIIFCLGAIAAYFFLKSFYDNAQRYEAMSTELREKSSKLSEAENELERLQEENKHLRTQWEKILLENNDLKDVNWSNSRYSYLISNAAKQAADLLKTLDVDWEYLKKKDEKKSPIHLDQKPLLNIQDKDSEQKNPEATNIFIEKETYESSKPISSNWKRF